jgi:O-acetylserine/cysteine efflux transporter
MPWLDIVGLILVQVIWGFHVAISKIGMHEFPPLMLTGLRFLAVAALLCPFQRLPRRRLLPIFGLSLTFGSLNYGLYFLGIAHLDASTAAIVGQAQVPISAILAAYLYNDRFGWRRLVGLALSFLGIILIVGQPRVGENIVWVLCMLGAALVSALGNVQIKALGSIGSLALTGWLAFFTAPQLLAASLLFESGQRKSLVEATWRGWGSLGYTVFVVAIGSYMLWYPLLRRFPLNQVMPFTLLIPLFGVLSGIVMLGETLNLQLLLGGVATIAGVAIIVLRQPQAGGTNAVPPVDTAPDERLIPRTEQGETDHVT